MPRSCGIRNSRGFGLPSDGVGGDRADLEVPEAERAEHPDRARRSCRSPRPARSGSPAGSRPATSPAAGRGSANARPAARRTSSERPDSSGGAQRQVVRPLGVQPEQQRAHRGLVHAHRLHHVGSTGSRTSGRPVSRRRAADRPRRAVAARLNVPAGLYRRLCEHGTRARSRRGIGAARRAVDGVPRSAARRGHAPRVGARGPYRRLAGPRRRSVAGVTALSGSPAARDRDRGRAVTTTPVQPCSRARR